MNYYDKYCDEYIRAVKRPVIFPVVKIEILDWNENVLGEVYASLDAENENTITIEARQGVRRYCTLTVLDDKGDYFPDAYTRSFWINRKFRVYVGVVDKWYTRESGVVLYESDSMAWVEYVKDGDLAYRHGAMLHEDTYYFSQGIFICTSATVTRESSKITVTINGVDKFGLFTADTNYFSLDGTYVVPVDTPIYNMIKDVLATENGAFGVADPVSPILSHSHINEVMPYELKRSSNGAMGDILTEIGMILGADIFYTPDGHLTIQDGTLDHLYSGKAPIYEFSDSELEYVSSSTFYDFANAYNAVKVTGTNMEENGYHSYTAENNNPESDTRIELIGRKIYPYESDSVYNDDRAKDLAEYILNRMAIVQKTMDFQCTLIPHLDVDTVVTITDRKLKYNKARFIIQSIEMPLRPGEFMQISASNTAQLPYYEGTASTSSELTVNPT